MGKPASAPVFMDGIRVGTVTVGDADDVSEFPLGEGFAFGPAPSPSAFPQYASREMPGRDLGPGHHASPGSAPHAAPHHPRTLGGAHPHPTEPHSRHLDPLNREHESGSSKPEHYAVGDIKGAVEGGKKAAGVGGWWTAERVQHGINKLMKEGGPTRSQCPRSRCTMVWRRIKRPMGC
jgi:hypothetical protein